jgi:hypothetical protein
MFHEMHTVLLIVMYAKMLFSNVKPALFIEASWVIDFDSSQRLSFVG